MRLEAQGAGAPAAERRARAILAAIAALPPLAYLAAERFVFGDLAGLALDDAWIHLVYGRGLAAGSGLAYAGGEPVAGSTAPLWSALAALAHLAPGSVFLWMKLAGIAAHAGACERAYVAARRLELAPARAALAAALVASTGWLAFAAVSGMEVALFVLLSMAALARHLEERRRPELPPLGLALCGLAALARPEGLLLLLLAAADRTLRLRRGPRGELALERPPLRALAVGLVAALALVGAVGAVYFALWGSPLPTTLAAKAGGAPGWRLDPRFLRRVLDLAFLAQPWTLLLAAGGAVELARRAGGRRDRGLLLPAWVIAWPLAASFLASGRGDLMGNFGRYYFPLLPPLALLALVALERCRPGRLRLGGGRGVPLGPPLALLLLAPSLASLLDGGRLHLQARANVDDSDVAVARWVAERLPAAATLAVTDVGAIAYLAPNPLVDLAGILDPGLVREIERARRERGAEWPAVVLERLERARPDYVILYPAWLPLLERAPARFPPVWRRQIPDNVTMAGDELVVYATPWTRYPLRPDAGANP